MELSAFAHMTGRDVKVIQPGLVYVIEHSAFADADDPTSSATPAPSQPTDVDESQLDSRQVRRLKRERMRADKTKTDAEKEKEILGQGTPDPEELGPVYVA
jgi:OTU domain-containing protein 3